MQSIQGYFLEGETRPETTTEKEENRGDVGLRAKASSLLRHWFWPVDLSRQTLCIKKGEKILRKKENTSH